MLVSITGQVCLVIYAPRKSVCDVYATRHGPLLHTLQSGANCRSACRYVCLVHCALRCTGRTLDLILSSSADLQTAQHWAFAHLLWPGGDRPACIVQAAAAVAAAGASGRRGHRLRLPSARL